MRIVTSLAVALLLLGAALGAQGKVPPPQISTFAPDPLFVAPLVPGSASTHKRMISTNGERRLLDLE